MHSSSRKNILGDYYIPEEIYIDLAENLNLTKSF
jgi:hypothetical protein